MGGGGGLGKAFDEKLMAIHQRFAELIKHHLDEALAEGSISDIDTEITAYAWLGAVNEILIRWLYTGRPSQLEDALQPLRGLLLSSISAYREG